MQEFTKSKMREPADAENYVRHTNNRGLYSEQTETRIAENAVLLADSYLIIPKE